MQKIIEIDNFELSSLCSINQKRYPFLLESIINNELNNYSILFAFPGETIKNCTESDSFLEKILSKNNVDNNCSLPFIGGYFIYLSYEVASNLEKTLKDYLYNSDEIISLATYIPVAIIKDHKLNKTFIIDEKNNYERIDLIKTDIKNIKDEIVTEKLTANISVEDKSIFINSVNIAKKYIQDGDIFQANLSRTWEVLLEDEIKDITIYNKLKKVNPSPFAAFAKFTDFSIISSSPERLFCVDNGIIQTRPIAGTRSRKKDFLRDEKLKEELKTNLKEQAEHLMLLDLERNDIGRVCKYGSVEVDEIMSIESYEFVHHIVSNIKGKLKNNISFIDIIKAIFPGGTITGCPKIRSMQIIAELEKSSRGAYTGSLGYVSNCGKMDFNILIRTMVKRNNHINFRAGAGIVFDSIAESELKETEHKATGLLKVFSS